MLVALAIDPQERRRSDRADVRVRIGQASFQRGGGVLRDRTEIVGRDGRGDAHLGGRIVQAWDIIHPEIMKVVGERAFLGGRRNITIVPTSLSVRPRLLGAATLPIKEIFSGLRITL